MILISIDPNVKRMAVAVWEHGELRQTMYLRSDLKGRASTFDQLIEIDVPPDEIAVEVPQIYSGAVSKKKGLMKLGFYAGFACGALYQGGHTTVHEYLPAQWKGQVPKDIMLPRIIEKLTASELTRVTLPTGKSYQHDVWDAVGIGLHHLGRLK